MTFLRRWGFWLLCLAALAGAAGVGALAFDHLAELRSAWRKLDRYQRSVRRYSTGDLPDRRAVEEARKLLSRWRDDIERMVRDNRRREYETTRFELFFSDRGLTRDIAGIDLNRYRSIYETKRDSVLARTRETCEAAFKRAGVPLRFSLPPRDACGFRYFGEGGELSRDALPVMQKRFWIASAVYDCIASYNSSPVSLKGWSFDPKEGDKPARIPAFVAAVRSVAHRGLLNPPDLPPDDRRYEDTREVMKPFYYYKYWRVRLELDAPAGALPGIMKVFLDHPLLFGFEAVSVRRKEKYEPDRYSLPLASVTLDLLVLDFDESLFPAPGGDAAAEPAEGGLK